MKTVFAASVIVLLSAFASAPAFSQPVPQRFASGYAGSPPTDPEMQPRRIFARPEAQAALALLEQGPRPRPEVAAVLAGSQTSIEDLQRTGLVRAQDDALAIDFAYFSQADMDRIHRAAERYAPQLVAAYLAHGREFDRIFARYREPFVSRADLAFVIIAGISLNWDGLDLTLARGWRAPRLMQSGESAYSFWASAETPDYSYRGVYWGSSSFPAGPYNFADAPADYTFSSFGDGYSDPRMNFPDLFYLPVNQWTPNLQSLAPQTGLRSESLAGVSIENTTGFSFARPVSAILFALHGDTRTQAELARHLQAEDAARLSTILAFLEQTHYIVQEREGRYRLAAPVLDTRDLRMLRDALALSRSIMGAWLVANYSHIRVDVGDLTITRNGLPYEAGFTQIWHELFGLTTRELARSGFVADPWAANAPSPGSLSVLWRRSLYDFTPG